MIRFTAHVHPGAKVAIVGGEFDGSLQVWVRARAVEGAATEETCAVLADAFHVRPSAVHCARGARSRTKLIVIEGDEERLANRLATLLQAN
ncbi:MAG: DUF167 domain-containing protein [Acidimicrobiales bacterium]